jgi:long-chain fatty acid transport protein
MFCARYRPRACVDTTLRLGPLALSVSLLLAPALAHAGGLYFSDRGVRPMSRGGAFVAGADDLGAGWYNPAGIAFAKSSFLADFTWVRFSNEYTRRLRLIDADGNVRTVESPTIKGSSPVLPLPTLVGSVSFGEKDQVTVAAGMYAPYIALASYSKTVAGQPSPARYTLGSFDGTVAALPGIWVGYRPIDELALGAGVSALVGTFKSRIAFSASPQDRLIGAPEQPEYDAESQMSIGPMFAPTANFGAIYIPHEMVRIGLAYQMVTVVDSDAVIKVKLPSSAVFDSAQVVGEKAHVRFKLPPILRFGVEVRPIAKLRVEVSFAREFWSVHDTIEAQPTDIRLQGIIGAPPSVSLPNISIPRHFQDSNSYRLGAEYTFPVGSYELASRAGVSYESSAVPKEYLSLSSLDFDKWTVALGGSLHIGKRWRFDAVLAFIFPKTTYVDPAEAKIPRINPLKGNAPLEPVNGGTYSANANLIGIGLEYKFDSPFHDPPPQDIKATKRAKSNPEEEEDEPAAKKDEPAPKPKPKKKFDPDAE